MKKSYSEIIKNLCILLLLLSITILMLNSILPVVKIDNYNGGKSLFLNIANMQENDNLEVQDTYNILEKNNMLLWIVIILLMLNLLALIIEQSEISFLFSKFLLGLGLPIFVISCLIGYNYYLINMEIININSLSFTNIIFPIKCMYIIWIFLFALLLISFLHFFNLLKSLFKEMKKYTDFRKEKKRHIKKSKKESESKDKEGKVLFEEKQEENINTKKEKIENWLREEAKTVASKDKQKLENEKGKMELNFEENKSQTKPEKLDVEIEKDEKSSETDEIREDKKVEYIKKSSTNVFKEDKNKTKSDSLEKLNTDKSLEEALNNAIKKKKGKGKSDSIDKENKQLKEVEEKKDKAKTEEEIDKYDVKCPKCNHVFSIDKKEGINKIKCPKCGKEGIVKL